MLVVLGVCSQWAQWSTQAQWSGNTIMRTSSGSSSPSTSPQAPRSTATWSYQRQNGPHSGSIGSSDHRERPENGVASLTVQPVMLFSSLSDAVSHYVYLKDAHQFAHCTKSDQAGGKHVIVSGVPRNEVKDTAWEHGFRAGVQHIMATYGQDDSVQAHFSKLMAS